jgi:uncharacterized protein involved in cysteine biosynthesis
MQSAKSTSTYQSALTVVVFLLIIWLLSGVTLIAQIAVGVGFLALLSSHIARWIDYGWTKVLAALGWFNSRVLLSVVFFLILAPIAFIYRLVKGDTLNLKTGKKSYFIDRSHTYEAKDLENPW